MMLLGAFTVSGCARTMVSDQLPAQLRLDAEGLAVGDGQRIDFGRAEVGAVAAVTRLLQAEPVSRATNAECGAGPLTTVSWNPGLDLMFQQGTLRGWSAASSLFVTTSGFSVGMSRQDLIAAGVSGFRETTLGVEVDLAPGVFALMDGDGPGARIALIWAGVSCFFR